VLYQHGALDSEACVANQIPLELAKQNYEQKWTTATNQKEEVWWSWQHEIYPHKQTNETDEHKTCPHNTYQTASNQTASNQTASNQTVSDQPVSDETASNKTQTTPPAQCSQVYERVRQWILDCWHAGVQAFSHMTDCVSHEFSMKLDWVLVQIIAREKCSEINKETNVTGCNINYLLHSPVHQEVVTATMLKHHDRRIRWTYMIFKQILPSLFWLTVFVYKNIGTFFFNSWKELYELYTTTQSITAQKVVMFMVSMYTNWQTLECEVTISMVSVQQAIKEVRRHRLGVAAGQEAENELQNLGENQRKMNFKTSAKMIAAAVGWNRRAEIVTERYLTVGWCADQMSDIIRTVLHTVVACIWNILVSETIFLYILLRSGILNTTHARYVAQMMKHMMWAIIFGCFVILWLKRSYDNQHRELQLLAAV
jgi:hypothetical protein